MKGRNVVRPPTKDPATLRATLKADRAEMARQLVEVVLAHGGAATVGESAIGDPSELLVRISAGYAYMTANVASDAAKYGYLTPWNIRHDSEAKFAPAFGSAVQAEVNPYHRRKCMGHESTFPGLLAGVARALDCIAEGRAFLV